jgi:hypothetical protein
MRLALQTDQFKGIKVMTLTGVREYAEEFPVELWCSPHGRLTVVSENEGGNGNTRVDLGDLIDWMRFGPKEGRVDGGFATGYDPERD